MSAWLKAGLIGTGVLVLLSLIGVIPLLNCITEPLSYLAYVLIGVLAAFFLPRPRVVRSAVKHGALANMLAGAVSGIVGAISKLIRASLMDWSIISPQADFNNVDFSPLPLPIYLWLNDVGGVSWELFRGAGVIIWIIWTCLSITLVAIILGAMGGGLYAVVKPE